jgi:predicted transport protein
MALYKIDKKLEYIKDVPFKLEKEIQPQKLYISFKINKRNICDIEIQNKQLKIQINLKKGELKDIQNIARDMSNVGHLAVGDYQVKINDDENIDYIVSLIKQSLTKNKNSNS